jgi:hypothetical protein
MNIGGGRFDFDLPHIFVGYMAAPMNIWWQVSHTVSRLKLNAYFYVCEDQVSHIKR